MNERITAACLIALAYAALCLAVYWRQRRLRLAHQREAAALDEGGQGQAGQEHTLVVFASQTGNAETLAWKTARWLHEGGAAARVMALDDLDAETLGRTRRAFFIASTYGEGDPPDGASVFAERVMGLTDDRALDLSGLRYAVLALGDRQYERFCAFGRTLDEWLRERGAAQAFESIEVDDGDPAQVAQWQTRLAPLSNAPFPAPSPARDEESQTKLWQLIRRTLLNAGSEGGPLYELAFTPADGELAWSSGDLVQIPLDSDPGRPRDYSIASIPADGELQLLVRQAHRADGTPGAASRLLTSTLAIGDTALFRLRAHRSFRLDGNEDRPLILIGNGAGLAGLRGHLRMRATRGQHDNWLIFGERHAARDFLCRDEIETWQRDGVLRRLDLAFSRDQRDTVYVQDRLIEARDEVTRCIKRGAAIYVCGSLTGMGTGVDAALRLILGARALGELSATDRYRRDLY